MATDNVDLPDLSQEAAPGTAAALLNNDSPAEAAPKHSAADLEAVFDVPVTVSAVLGKSAMEVSQLLKLGKGTVVELRATQPDRSAPPEEKERYDPWESLVVQWDKGEAQRGWAACCF